jgi:sugar phosphate isomerase/epimerase
MEIGICSFSFHRLLASGQADVFGYMDLCKELGCTQLDPWSAHLSPPVAPQSVLRAGKNPRDSHQLLGDVDFEFIDRIGDHAKRIGLPFGTIAVDGAHIFEPGKEARQVNRKRAHRWLEAAGRLGAKQVRIDAGGQEEMPDEAFQIIVEGYRDLIARATPLGIEILIENHWGPSIIPDNTIRILDAARALGLLYDTRNWRPDKKQEGRRRGAPHARATHIKTRRWDAAGSEPDEDIPGAIRLLIEAAYTGTWGIESVPEDGDEIAGARKTIELIRRTVSATLDRQSGR